MPSRSTLIAQRWISVVACGIAAGSAWILIQTVATKPLLIIWSALGDLPSTTLLFAVSVLLTVGSWQHGRSRWIGYFGLKHAAVFPPIWIAAVVGVFLVGIVPAAEEPYADLRLKGLQDITALDLVAFAAPPMLLLAGTLTLGRSQHRKISQSFSDDRFIARYQWVFSDTAILSDSEDLFQHRDVAQRIARRLTAAEELPSIALVGPVGAGKTTIKNLVKQQMVDKCSSIIVDISLWPYEAPEAAVAGIIEAVNRAVSKHVNILSIAGIPDQYVRTIENAPGPLRQVAPLLREKATPGAILARLSAVAKTINIRFIIWIEDLERFAITTSSGQSDGRMGPILSLLHQLECTSHLSVVIADASPEKWADIWKLVRYVEHPPRVEESHVCDCINTLRNKFLSGHPRVFIDPIRIERMRGEIFQPSPLSIAQFGESAHSDYHLAEAITNLVGTPRQLKAALRIFCEAWEDLIGEVDIDDLLIASILRTTRPQLAALIDKDPDVFRVGFKTPFDKEHISKTQYEDMLDREDFITRQSIRVLIQHLFPGIPFGGYAVVGDFTKPQGVCSNFPRDYWRLITSRAAPYAIESDQNLLHCLSNWKEGQPNNLVERVCFQNQGRRIANFRLMFTASDSIRLFEETFARLQTIPATNPDVWPRFDPLITIWDMLRAVRHHSESDVAESVIKLVREYAHLNLPICHFLVDLATSPTTHYSLSHRVNSTIIKAFYDAFCDNLMGLGVVHLQESLKGFSPVFLKEMFGLFRRVDPHSDSHIPFTKWRKTAHLLIELLERFPPVGAVAVAVLIVDEVDPRETNGGHRDGRHVVEERVSAMFDRNLLVPMLAKVDESSLLHDVANTTVIAIQWARGQLKAS